MLSGLLLWGVQRGVHKRARMAPCTLVLSHTHVHARAQEYCISRDQFDYVLDVTKFKTKAPWGEDPYKDVPTKVKTAFTRCVAGRRGGKGGG